MQMSSRTFTRNHSDPSDPRNHFFLFLQSVIYDQTNQMLIIYNNRFYYAMIDEANSHYGSFFIIDGQSVFVSPDHIIIPGPFGSQPSIFIRCPETGQNLIARFVGFFDEKFCEETDQTTVFFEVILRGTSELRVVLQSDICPFFPTPEQIEEHDSRLLLTRHRAAHGCDLVFPLNTEWTSTNYLAYPHFKLKDIFVLWNLCRIHDVKIGFDYNFNCLLIRFLACGSQERYFENGIEEALSMLTVRDQIDLSEFLRIYDGHMMGTKMVSKSQRCSEKSILEIFIEEFSHAKACNASSTFALNLPASYFMRQNPNVLVVLRNTHVEHSFLLPVPVENPE